MLFCGILVALALVGCTETGEPKAGAPDAAMSPCGDGPCPDAAVVDTTGRVLGEPCDSDRQCESGRCYEARYCTVDCEAACPADARGEVYDCEGGRCVRREVGYAWLVLVDTSGEAEALTPGADICGASYDCDGTEAPAEDAVLRVGRGEVCGGEPECASPRDVAAAALDLGLPCDEETSPSAYVSLGVGGELALRFPRDVRGCRLSVTDRAGAVPESYAIYVCRGEEAVDCLNDGASLWETDEGGRHIFDVP